ncbi:MAG: lysylphosphatidylglycerol synthase transmembrane domain-containing protein [Candidatus Hodarchaeales archaeon]
MAESSELVVQGSSISLRKAFDKKTLMLVSFAVIALTIYLFLENVSVIDMIAIFFKASLPLLVLGASFTFVAVLCDALAWKVLLSISSINPSLKKVYRIQLSSFSYGLLIPSAGAVEVIMRVALGSKEFTNRDEKRNATSGEVLSSVVAHKLCGLIVFIPISAYVAFAILKYLSDIVERRTGTALSSDFAVFFVLIISVLSIVVLGIFVLIAKSPKKANKVFTSILQKLVPVPLIGSHAKKAINPTEKMIDDFSVQFSYLAQNKKLSFLALVLSFLSQIAHWISIFFILHAIAIPILLDQVAAVNFLGGTVDFIPVGIPGMAGLKEISLSVFLKEVFPDPDGGSTLATSGAILVQLVKFYFLILVGIMVYIIGKSKITSEDLSKETPS